ncbi:hypothetical protein DL771_004495 [Monosporascus sp. 5C6A]|nr:hypothetical protein DL771_004495 [Monosporascus sp. 5C6A]
MSKTYAITAARKRLTQVTEAGFGTARVTRKALARQAPRGLRLHGAGNGGSRYGGNRGDESRRGRDYRQSERDGGSGRCSSRGRNRNYRGGGSGSTGDGRSSGFGGGSVGGGDSGRTRNASRASVSNAGGALATDHISSDQREPFRIWGASAPPAS